MFFANLNVFVALFAILGIFAAGPLVFAISVLATPLRLAKVSGIDQYLFPAAYLLLAVSLAFLWRRKGLVPKVRAASSERRYRIGQRTIAITNIASILAFTAPFMIALITSNPDYAMLAWFAVPVLGLGIIAWAIGLYMVWSARA